MLRSLLIVIAVFMLIQAVNSATIEGKIYSWDTFEPAKNCIVTLNSTPVQKLVVVNGSYSFTTSPGTYRIDVVCYGHQNLVAGEVIKIKQNGTFHIDILAQPELEEMNVSVPEINFSVDERVPPQPQNSLWNYAYLVIPLTLAAGVWYYLRRIKVGIEKSEDILPEDLSEIIEIIKKEGGRITQKELKRRTGYSDAKISLMIADLEKRGKVEKVKKGRGNIIFLKE